MRITRDNTLAVGTIVRIAREIVDHDDATGQSFVAATPGEIGIVVDNGDDDNADPAWVRVEIVNGNGRTVIVDLESWEAQRIGILDN